MCRCDPHGPPLRLRVHRSRLIRCHWYGLHRDQSPQAPTSVFLGENGPAEAQRAALQHPRSTTNTRIQDDPRARENLRRAQSLLLRAFARAADAERVRVSFIDNVSARYKNGLFRRRLPSGDLFVFLSKIFIYIKSLGRTELSIDVTVTVIK